MCKRRSIDAIHVQETIDRCNHETIDRRNHVQETIDRCNHVQKTIYRHNHVQETIDRCNHVQEMIYQCNHETIDRCNHVQKIDASVIKMFNDPRGGSAKELIKEERIISVKVIIVGVRERVGNEIVNQNRLVYSRAYVRHRM